MDIHQYCRSEYWRSDLRLCWLGILNETKGELTADYCESGQLITVRINSTRCLTSKLRVKIKTDMGWVRKKT